MVAGSPVMTTMHIRTAARSALRLLSEQAFEARDQRSPPRRRQLGVRWTQKIERPPWFTRLLLPRGRRSPRSRWPDDCFLRGAGPSWRLHRRQRTAGAHELVRGRSPQGVSGLLLLPQPDSDARILRGPTPRWRRSRFRIAARVSV